MPHFKHNIDLKAFNTFGISAKAKIFISLHNEDELTWLIDQKEYTENKVLWLGGGSNILLSQDFDGLVVQINFLGKSVETINENWSLLSANAGENWHNLVLYALQKNLGGIENLSLIPGNAGTAPIQNIGAYGVELKDKFYALKAFDLLNKGFVTFNHEQCQFGYRDSIFKREGKGRYIICSIQLKLSRKEHKLNIEYGAIKNELNNLGLQASIHNISKAVISIRQSKLPDPKNIGNSGSFFKNPIVNASEYREILKAYPNVAAYELSPNEYKLAAGWLIEQSGWKGYRKGDAGVHSKQALVLVNYGEALGEEILAIAKAIKESVFSKFAVSLNEEVNII